MPIKRLELSDIKDCIPVGRKMFIDGKIEGSFDERAVYNTFFSIANSREHFGFIYKDETVKGIALFYAVPSIWDTKYKKFVEVVWHADPDLSVYQRGKIMLLLLKAVLEYVKGKGEMIHIGLKDQTVSLARLLEKYGFEKRDTRFVMEL